MSLRLRILAGLVGLLVLGLAAFGVGINKLMQGSMENQLSQELATITSTVRQVLATDKNQKNLDRLFDVTFQAKPGARDLPYPVELKAEPSFPPGVVVEVRTESGTLLDQQVYGGKRIIGPGPWPWQPTEVKIGSALAGTSDRDFRAVSMTMQESGESRVVTVALPMDSVNRVERELTVIELLLGGIVVVIGAVLALVVARVTARPLARIAATADAISGGDLTRRVPDSSPKTEVGRVGLALNLMLGQIQRYVERLVESEQRMRRFLGDASHELSTPLTSIRGYAELFRGGARDRPEDLARAMSRIESEAARMTGLVEELLLLAELDEGRPLSPVPVDLAMIAADAVDDARLAAPDRSIELDVMGDEGVVLVQGEENRLRQVAANLLSNACRHTPPGTPIRVTVTPGMLEVADEGPGMESERAARIFDRFYGDGSGLGLSIVSSIVRAHGGRVRVISSPGAGATFRVELPEFRHSDRILTKS
jgi:two-component system OmpR family sensor kinase